MITATGRFPEEPLPGLGPESAEAPEFPVTFSRPAELTGRPDAWPNSFRWFGKGTLRILERGLLISAKRRFAIRFHSTEQRFVPATEISDVCREGNAVRVDLRGEARNRGFFQFWTGDASTAGTIVRLLPTKRTIEYEEPPAAAVPDRNAQPAPGPAIDRVQTVIGIAFVVTLIAMGSLITATLLRDRTPQPKATPPSPSATATPQTAVAPKPIAPPERTALEIANARLVLLRYDTRLDGLHAEFKMAFTALQHGDLTQAAFINGVNTWLIPQWRTLHRELASGRQDDPLPDSLVREHLMTAALGWEGALREYVRGLEERNELTVLGALDQMSAANEAQQQARYLIERDER
jgi:hypothetical protein